jgi:CBS domain-containing protein
MLTATDLMTHDVEVVHASWSVRRLIEFLVERNISGAPVVSDEGLLVGVVSYTDIARSRGTGPRRRTAERAHEYYLYGPAYAHGAKPADDPPERLKVQEIMTEAVFDVPSTATAKEIAEMMLRGRIHRVFVTESGMVIGVITSLDMLKALL